MTSPLPSSPLAGPFRALALACAAALLAPAGAEAATDYVRVNQVGYLSTDTKVAVGFAASSLSALTYSVVNASSGAVLWGPAAFPTSYAAYAPFNYVYQLDFSAFQPPSAVTCAILLSDGTRSPNFQVGPCVYAGTEETILNFWRAQNCGPGNWYDVGAGQGVSCHTAPGTSGAAGDEDGMVVDGPNAGSTLNTEGAWHDSGDYIKFMVTVAWVDEVLLFSYQEHPSVFQDSLGASMQAGANGVPDVLDEGRYGLNWIMAMHPSANTFYYDVGDGRDHNNFGTYLPQNDGISYAVAAAPDNGVVPVPYRPVYGGAQDQGGTQNCARAAAALAMGYQIWSAPSGFQDAAFAATCLTHAEQLYALGKSQNAVQVDVDGFYPMNGFDPDMEMAAAQLYKATGTASYLADAESYAAAAGSAGGEMDWSTTNFLAHYCLYQVAPAAEQATLSGYMQSDLNAALALSNANPYGLAYKYVWGTLEDSTSVAAMTELWATIHPTDATYTAMGTANRDFLLGKNPWGVCFVQGMGTTYPHYPQHNISMILYQKTPYGSGTATSNTPIPGMVIEGPVDYNDFVSQGITLSGSDVYGAFDNATAGGWVYHDDNEDYSSNEPTTSGAVWALNVLADQAASCSTVASPTPSPSPSPSRTPSATSTVTRTSSPSPSPTASPSVSRTGSPTPSATPSGTPSLTPSVTEAVSATPSASLSPTLSETEAVSATPSATPSLTLSVTEAVSATPSASPSLTLSVTEAVSATPSATPSLTPSVTEAVSATPSVSPSLTPSVTEAVSATPSATPSLTPSVTEAASATPSSTPSPTLSVTAAASATPSANPSQTASPIQTPSSTPTPSSASPTPPQASLTASSTPTGTLTPGMATASATTVPLSEGTLVITQAAGLPNPNAKFLAYYLSGDADRLELDVFSRNFVLVGRADAANAGAGWNRIPLPDGWSGLSNGTWFYRLTAFRGSAVSQPRIGSLFLAR